ncbi:MAG: YdbH domain-containing protein [Henriciella sp.]|uniref:intermembrane phospholipid transport protein YdbH family protein n=1 Tax=Henriciella sp. TaxID=1968823 RepID=UPI0032EE558E
MAARRSRIRPWLVGAGTFLGICLLAVGLAWVFRMPLAGWATRSWCNANDFECQLDVTALDLSGLEVRNLRMSATGGNVPLEAARARIDLTWNGLFTPVVTRVDVLQPTLRGRYTPEGEMPADFGGLETLIPSGGGGSTDLPDVSIDGATIELDTPAGPVRLNGSFSGKLPYQGRLQAKIEPVELSSEGNRLVIRRGEVDLDYVGIKLDGHADFELAEAEFDGLSARDVSLSLNMAETLQPQVEWQATINRLNYRDISVEQADASGMLKPQLDSDPQENGVLAAITKATLSATVSAFDAPFATTGPSNLTLDVTRDGKDTLEAEFALRSEALREARLSANRVTVSGTATTDNRASSLNARGKLVLEGAELGDTLKEAITSAVSFGPPVTAHSDALQAWLRRALSDFSLGSGLEARWRGGDDWSLVSDGTVSAKTPQGAALTIAPQDTHPAINLSPGHVELRGLLDLAGGNAPRLTALLRRASFGGGQPVEIETGGVSLKPWTANGITLAADLNEISLTTAGDSPRLRTVGEVNIDGRLYSMGFSDTRLFGGVDAVFDRSGVRVQTYKTRCIGLDTGGVLLSGGFGIGDTSFQLCPIDGRVVRQSNGVASGRFDLGSVSVPFTSNSTSGTLGLESALLDWQAGQRAALSIKAGAMQLPLEIGGETLTIAATTPTLGIRSGQPANLTADVAYTEFSGSVLPAAVSLESASFDSRLAAAGLEGSATATRVEMRDPGEDPLYEPLTGDLTADFSEGIMTLRGPVTTPRAGQTIANAELTLDLGTLDGHAQVRTADLVFEPGRFQPTALSDRVRGFLSNARGELQAEASFDIDGGSPSGTGWVSVSDFGFDTLRLGAVQDVDGRIDFDDILALSTPPGQEVRIGQISPGIPLQDGVVVFQLNSATEAIIERARWPFAGGELVVGRSSWTISGTRDVISVKANELELSSLINVFNLPDIDARGTVSGEFPVEIEGPNAYIRGATLKADDRGGTIAYTGEAGDAASQADDRVEMAFNALKDFHFSVLEMGADGNLSGDMMITMKLVGTSPKVLDGAPFAFNIGIDSKLMQLIQTGKRMTGSEWLADVVAEQVRGGNTASDESVEDSE